MSHTHAFARLLAGASIAVAGCLVPLSPASAAFSNVTDYFELDGNVLQQAGTTKDDWSNINTGGASLIQAPNSLIKRTGVLADPAPKTIYTGGGSKDVYDLSGALANGNGWQYKDGSVPDKDDITNAFAAAYNVGGDLVIYAGADRFDNSGDAFMGFWFFKSNISLSNGKFNGTHTVGDVLVLANFTGGGTTITVQVLEWNPAKQDAAPNLHLLAGDTVTNAKCGSSVSNLYCGISNAANGVPTSWPYTSKSGTPTYLSAEFLEIGINISQVLKLGQDNSAPCFSSFLAETRSSSSATATLKDFVLGSFDVCGVSITKACDAGSVNQAGTAIVYPFHGQITNTGFGTLSNFVLNDTPQAATPTPTVGAFSFNDCSGNSVSLTTLGPGASVCYSSTLTTTNNGSTNQISVTANTTPTTTTTSDPASTTCPIVQFNKGLTVTKNCTASLENNGSALQVRIDVSGTLCNNGTLGVTNASVLDFVGGGSTGTSLALDSTTIAGGGACANYSGHYYPTAPDANTTTQFSDAVSGSATLPPLQGGGTVTTGATKVAASCNLCPTGVCTTSNGTLLNSIIRK